MRTKLCGSNTVKDQESSQRCSIDSLFTSAHTTLLRLHGESSILQWNKRTAKKEWKQQNSTNKHGDNGNRKMPTAVGSLHKNAIKIHHRLPSFRAHEPETTTPALLSFGVVSVLSLSHTLRFIYTHLRGISSWIIIGKLIISCTLCRC